MNELLEKNQEAENIIKDIDIKDQEANKQIELLNQQITEYKNQINTLSSTEHINNEIEEEDKDKDNKDISNEDNNIKDSQLNNINIQKKTEIKTQITYQDNNLKNKYTAAENLIKDLQTKIKKSEEKILSLTKNKNDIESQLNELNEVNTIKYTPKVIQN